MHSNRKDFLGSGIRVLVWRVEYQKRGLRHASILGWIDDDTDNLAAIDEVVNVRVPRNSSFTDNRARILDFRTPIRNYQMHMHSKRCVSPSGPWKLCEPQPPRYKL
jgi:hypothetical protein